MLKEFKNQFSNIPDEDEIPEDFDEDFEDEETGEESENSEE